MAAVPDSSTELPASANPAAEKPIFTQCLTCHTARPGEPHRIGPNLWGVLGRPVASADWLRLFRGAAEPWWKLEVSLRAGPARAGCRGRGNGRLREHLAGGSRAEPYRFHLQRPCHSLALVKQQGLSRESWDELLDWMVEEQGMGEPGPEQRKETLDYLATHFGIEHQ